MAKEKTASKKKSAKKSTLSLYSNLAYKRKVKEDQRARKQAEELAKLPKNPILRFFARLRPDRVFKWWFSKRGQLTILKIIGCLFLLGVIGIGGLFLYYKKDLAEINPEELASHVKDTVNVYLDRNGEKLWEDKGNGDYRLVVDGADISTYMRQATVAIEDKNFYKHMGVDFKALIRAAYVTLTGGNVQGGSTLTQQLIKQVYFSDEAKNRTLSGLPRKIKEMILAIEVEKMYNKEQLITLYLNESPYGGRRNGIESAARTYFNKSAKELDLAESALLAAVPNNPGVLNPYNQAGHKALIARQHKVLDSMVEMDYISQEEADAAKAVDILSKIQPESDQYEGILAPWFVLEVKAQLEEKYGIKTMREGGFTITTTLDLRAQRIAEEAVRAGSEYFRGNGSDNATLVSVDTETAQIVAMVGSVDWTREGYGQVNAATSLLEPASSIKPILDYTPLFMQREGVNWGPGSLLMDDNIDAIYCKGNTSGKCKVRNASGKFYGLITLRQSLAGSLNIGAIKALHINGIENSLKVAHDLGDKSYCEGSEYVGLSAAIGGGCSVRPVEHANAYASLARGGVYKDLVYWTKIQNSSGDVVEEWVDNEGTRVVDEQTAYMTTSILSDINARRTVFGSMATAAGFYSNKVWFAAKTGTTDNGRGRAKDSWIMTYSPVLATAIWNGNHDGRALTSDNHNVCFKISANYIDRVHEEVYQADGRWTPGMKIQQPAGMQTLTVNGKTDIWPSWYNKSKSSIKTEKMVFDSVSKKKATDCTPESTRVEVSVTKMIDPMTQKEVFYSSDYDTEHEDDVHVCGDAKPTVSISIKENTTTSPGEGGEAPITKKSWTITATAAFGRYELSSYTLSVNGQEVESGPLAANGGTIEYTTTTKPTNVSFTAKDSAGYSATATSNVK